MFARYEIGVRVPDLTANNTRSGPTQATPVSAHQHQQLFDFRRVPVSFRLTRPGSRGHATTNESAGGYANPCLTQTITLHQNVRHGQEASPACFEGTTARIGHLAPRGRLSGRNGDREYQGFHSERALRVVVGDSRRLTLGLVFGQLEAKVFYPKGELQRESYRTKDGKVRGAVTQWRHFTSDY